MACLALKSPPDDVKPVREKRVIGNPIQPDPADLLLLLGVVGQLLLFLDILGLLRLGPIVAVHAVLQPWHPGRRVFLIMGMTCLALCVFQMGLMAETHGLLCVAGP